MIRTNRITVIEKEPTTNNFTIDEQIISQKRISIGSDHTGFKMKNILIKYLGERGFQLNDEGTFDEKSCDYLDFAKAVALKVATGNADFGIILDATGIPSSITANKIKGIRAATCYNAFSAKSAREHNDANVLVLGAKSLGEETIKTIIEVWFSTNFAGGRHQRRLDKISSIENEKD
ncbi:MAG: ribose 5-phosphate isomerase B [Ignavibacteriae bacterium]|nr:MAG: ribose 5-phosphate isomerase B [Ignavibacteriota bacterium]